MVKTQKQWCAGKSGFYVGIDVIYIFKEKKGHWDKTLARFGSPAMDAGTRAELGASLDKKYPLS